jgi:acetyltransferase-like isoleucine patch superfamily enzyme
MMANKTKNYNLKKEFHNESTLKKYQRLIVGENTSLFFLIVQEFFFLFLPWIPGALGLLLRNLIYPMLFPGINRSAHIGSHVTLRCPLQITLAPRVIIDDFAQLIATTREKPGISIGDNSFVRSFSSINAGPPHGFVKIGSNSSIGQGTIIYGNGGVKIGNHVMIAGQCFIVASSHLFDSNDAPMSHQGISAKGIEIEDNVWIGAGVKILDGVCIGRDSIIGANSVVTKNIPPKSKAVGIPARVIGSTNEIS